MRTCAPVCACSVADARPRRGAHGAGASPRRRDPCPQALGPSVMAAIRREAPCQLGAPPWPRSRTCSWRGSAPSGALRRRWAAPSASGSQPPRCSRSPCWAPRWWTCAISCESGAARRPGHRGRLAARNTAMQVVADPSHASAWLSPSTTEVVTGALMVYLPGSTDAFLVADGLPATPDGRVYQFWYADAGGVHAGVTFHHDGAGRPASSRSRWTWAVPRRRCSRSRRTGVRSRPSQDVVFGELPSS